MNDISTKDKILLHAHKLFAEKGFNGVSIREIAKTADVNVAAINYHFENKENLFKETIRSCINQLTCELETISRSGECKDVADLAVAFFRFYVKNADDFRASFKMFVIDADNFPEDINADDDAIGPPGSSIFYEFIKNEKPSAGEEDMVWAVRSILSIVMHKSLIMTSKCVTARKLTKSLGQQDFEDAIRRIVRLVVNDIN